MRKWFHPLFHFRKLRAFHYFQSILDVYFWAASGSGMDMYVKLLRDLSLAPHPTPPHDGKEKEPRELFGKILD